MQLAKLAICLVGSAFVINATLFSGAADAAGSSKAAREATARRQAQASEARRAVRAPRESSGPCMRDTGKPDSQLSFRNRCDTEEFWLRMQQGLGGDS